MKTNLLLIAALFMLFAACADSMSTDNAMLETERDSYSDGVASKTAAGGTPGYTYAWSDGDASSDLAAGTYTVSVTDASGNSTNAGSNKPQDVSHIIKTGSMGMKVIDYAKTLSAIRHQVNLSGGYVGNEGELRDQYQVSNTLTIRVPSQNFESLMDNISKGADTLYYRNINTQDVGEEYADLVARLKAKRAVEARYLEILKKADTIPDILAVEEKLRRIQEEIESQEGRKRYLDNQVGMSSVTVNLTQEFDVEPPKPIVAGFFTKFLGALTTGWNGILSLILALATSWPIWLVIALSAVITKRYLSRKKAAKEAMA